MTERSFFDFGSQSGDSDRLDPRPWDRRFQDLAHSIDENIVEATFDADELPTHGEIIELIESLHASDSSPFVAPAVTDRAYSIHLPEHYEAGYAYPLVVWFHQDNSSESELSSVMPKISERNYVGLALRGNRVLESGFGWSSSDEDVDKLLVDVEAHVRTCRREYHIHSERIYLAGYGTGASAAMALLLRKPEWFGGAACLCGSFPKLRVPSHRFNDLRNKRILLTTSAANRSSGVGEVVAAGRLLYSSGMQIGTRVYQEAGVSPSNKMLRDLNHWLMDDVCSVAT